MTKKPLVVSEDILASKALGIMNEKKITSLLVVSEKDYKKKNKILKRDNQYSFSSSSG